MFDLALGVVVSADRLSALSVARTFTENRTVSPKGVMLPVIIASTPATCPSFLAVDGSIKPLEMSLCS